MIEEYTEARKERQRPGVRRELLQHFQEIPAINLSTTPNYLLVGAKVKGMLMGL